MNHFVSKARQQFGMMGGPKSTWGGGTYMSFDGEGVKVSRGGAPHPLPTRDNPVHTWNVTFDI